MDYGYLNGTNYNPNVPFGENWADWSSAGWGNGWAGTAGGVARQLGLNGRAMAEFARAVNNQKRRLAEAASGGYYGYKPELEVPSWILQLYQSKGMDTGGRIPTGMSGVGKRVNLGALQIANSNRSQGNQPGTAGGRARARGLSGRDLATAVRQENRSRRQMMMI